MPTPAVGAPVEAVRWARGVLVAQGLDPAEDRAAAVLALRLADADLGESVTRYLVECLTTQDRSSGHH